MRSTLSPLQASVLALSAMLAALCVEIVTAAPAHGVDAEIKQQILPLDCLFDTVNDGSGTIIYLTPVECGVPPVDPDPDPDPEPNPEEPTPTTPTTPRTVTIIDTGARVLYQIPLLPDGKVITSYSGPGEYVTGLPFQRIANVEGAETLRTPQQQVSSTVPVVLIVVLILAIILIAVIVIF